MDTHAKRREATIETSYKTGDCRVPSGNQSPGGPGIASDTPACETGNTQATENT